MAEGDIRRERILEILHGETQPVSGTELAGRLGVSRQVIVQDIALLRATDKNILSTNKGYILFAGKKDNGKKRRTYKVRHMDREIMDELWTVVDFGGKILDVVVEHPLYGQLTGQLHLASRYDVRQFLDKVATSEAKPLAELTAGVHLHTLRCPDRQAYERVLEQLRQAGFLYQ